MADKTAKEIALIRQEFFHLIGGEDSRDPVLFDSIVANSNLRDIRFEETRDKSSLRCNFAHSERKNLSAYNFYLNPDKSSDYFFRVFVSEEAHVVCVDKIEMNKAPIF